MDEENKSRKLKEAERLRTKRVFPLNLFSSPDYDVSAEIFVELGNVEESVDKKIRYYEEAANTYLMGDSEYSRYQAFQIYEKIGQMCEESDPRRSVQAYRRSGRYSKQCGRESLAAVSFQRAADILRKLGDDEGALECLNVVVECYRGSNWKHHKAKAMRDVANICVELGRYGKAAEVFLTLKENIFVFCAFLCYVIEGTPSDLDVVGDEKIICDALERDIDTAYRAIDEYADTHAMIGEVSKLLGVVKERLRPENDIL